MFWSGEKLANSRSVVVPFDDKQIDCNAYNLRMGSVYYRTGEREAGYEQKKIILKDGEALLIPPGQFAFLLTKETVRIPASAMAFISMRTGIKFQGLINVSGFHVDPGYDGKLIYAVYNASPSAIQICENDKIFKIWFCDLNAESSAPYVFSGTGLTDISSDLIKGMNQEIYSLQSLAEKMRTQKTDIEAKLGEQKPIIENLQMIYRGAATAVIYALIVAFLTFMLPTMFKLGDAASDFIFDHRPAKSVPKKATSPSDNPAAH